MSAKLLSVEQILTLLVATPERISALIAALSPTQVHTSANSGEWSVHEVLAHLRACADVWGNCMETIIAEERPVLRAVNPLTWIKQTDYLTQAFQSSLHAFTMQRTELLAVLSPLPPEGWQRSATVTGAGKVLERTVLFYGDWLARHERQHIKQIERIVNTLSLQE